MRRVVLALLLVSTSAFAQTYDVFAVRYATIPGFPVADLVQGAEAGRKIDIAMMVWVVRGGGHNVVVDSDRTCSPSATRRSRASRSPISCKARRPDGRSTSP